MMGKNGFFQLIHREDGTYIKLYPAINGGIPVTYDMVSSYLTKKKITNYDLKELGTSIATLSEEKEVRLNQENCLPENEYLEVVIDESRTKAIGVFYPPSSKGKLMTREEIVNHLVHTGIKCGLIDTNIDCFLADRTYCTELVLAEAIMPMQGKSAVITYNFRTEGTSKPKINEDGSVDFHQLDMINKVNAGDIIATLEPVDYGKPGIDILGSIIKPKKVVAKILKHGGNIHLSEDKTIMYSDVSGHVTLIDDRVFVSNTYEVPADVSVASGDIDYDGNVMVHGNVVTGFTVRAKGDIIIDGVVEGGTLISEGQIILKRGVQGMGKGKLISKGNLTARFIENCEVISGGDITTDAIMHSHVSAKGEVLVTGKKSMITGGEVKAGKGITAKTIGSSMCTQTVLSIGIDDNIKKEQKNLEKEIEDIKKEQTKYAQVFNLFKKRMQCSMGLTIEQKKQLVIAKQEFTRLQESLATKEPRYLALKAEIDSFQDGKIRFTGSVYPGVKIIISSTSMFVKEEISHGQFVRDRADIRVMAI
ncbi:MAG: DUF342 domain-containing protein [Velocimicrobium sp.]